MSRYRRAAARVIPADFAASLTVNRPDVSIFGINPHAGEVGLFGNDDHVVTIPAVEQLRALRVRVEGPVGADVMLARPADFDAFIAMYHDQGHIPVKILAGRKAAAVSIGSGILVTSVGHGTAFDIAGRGIADPSAFLAAIQVVHARSRRGRPQSTSHA